MKDFLETTHGKMTVWWVIYVLLIGFCASLTLGWWSLVIYIGYAVLFGRIGYHPWPFNYKKSNV